MIVSISIMFMITLLIPHYNTAFAQSDVVIPEWIKYNAKWFAEGKITEEENKAALQFFVKNNINIFKRPDISQLTEDIEVEPGEYDDIRAQSYVVKFSNGDFKSPLEISTFGKYDTDQKPGEVSPEFILESNPSIEKLEFYELIAKTYNPGKIPQLFDVEVDILSGDDIPIISTFYAKCKIVEYLPYIQEFILFYTYSESDNGEIRDRTGFKCSGIKIIVHDSDEKYEHQANDPSYENRVTSYVAHFYGPDIEGLYSIGTFFNFIPTDNIIRTPYDIVAKDRTNPVGSKPKFMLESLPSEDKKQLYEFYSMYVNPGRVPQLFDVSVDLILGDGTIIQRWNYVKCDITDYILRVDESLLRYPASDELQSEIRDQSQFSCNGFNLQTGMDLPKNPIKDPKTEQGIFVKPKTPNYDERANTFIISVFGGEFTDILTGNNIYKFEALRLDRGDQTPSNAANQYTHGFLVESLPTQEKKQLYEFLARYVNAGKEPEPFDVTVDTILGNGDILHRLHYTKCDVRDIGWYLQDATWIYQFNGQQQEEIRSKYILECIGFKIIP